MPNEDHQTLLSQKVEREVRHLIGELQMQALVLRQMLELAQGGQQPGQPKPQEPHPMPPGQPTPPPSPDVPQQPTARSNGGTFPREV